MKDIIDKYIEGLNDLKDKYIYVISERMENRLDEHLESVIADRTDDFISHLYAIQAVYEFDASLEEED